MRHLRIAGIAFALLTTIAATACGGSGGEGDDVTPTATETASPAETPSPASTPTSPAPTAESTADTRECSAAGMDTSAFTENPDLTGPANETRREIAFAAVDCDYDTLAELTADDFTYSFGDSGNPAGHWRQLEEEGRRVLATLVTLLTLDTQVEEAGEDAEDEMAETVYTWPRAYRGDGEDARAELERAFGEETVAEWYTPDGDYVGWRVGLTGDGRWIFYVAGD